MPPPDTYFLTESVSAFRAALEVFVQKNFPYFWNIAKRNLENALESLEQMEKDE